MRKLKGLYAGLWTDERIESAVACFEINKLKRK